MSKPEKFAVEYKDHIGRAYYRVTLQNGEWIIGKKKKHAGPYTEAGHIKDRALLRHHLNATFAPMDVYDAVMNAAQSA